MTITKIDYIYFVNCFNNVSGFKIHLRKNAEDSYDDLLPYTSLIQSIIPKAEHYEKIRKQGYCDDFLEKELGKTVLEINQKTLCVV